MYIEKETSFDDRTNISRNKVHFNEFYSIRFIENDK